MERGNRMRWHNVSSLNRPRWPKVVARWLAVWNFGLELEVTLTRDSTSLLHLVLLMGFEAVLGLILYVVHMQCLCLHQIEILSGSFLHS